MHPRISVITPSFNAAKTLERAIKSVLVQGYKNVEHIIVDGGSTDGTADLVQSYPHVQFSWEKDQGQSDAMNKGFDKATGELIVYLNADDEFAPGVFSRVVEAYERLGRSKKFMMIMDLLIEESGGLRWTAVPSVKFSDIADPEKMLFPYNPVSYFYHRHVQELAGKFPVELNVAMDYWFLLRAYGIAEIHYESFVAGTFYNYNNKTSGSNALQVECLKVLVAYYRKKLPLLFNFNRNVISAKKQMLQFRPEQ
jgi:glycosyltransferase involved in cell wall biosynthesis